MYPFGNISPISGADNSYFFHRGFVFLQLSNCFWQLPAYRLRHRIPIPLTAGAQGSGCRGDGFPPLSRTPFTLPAPSPQVLPGAPAFQSVMPQIDSFYSSGIERMASSSRLAAKPAAAGGTFDGIPA
jgi:hypothetical protein